MYGAPLSTLSLTMLEVQQGGEVPKLTNDLRSRLLADLAERRVGDHPGRAHAPPGRHDPAVLRARRAPARPHRRRDRVVGCGGWWRSSEEMRRALP